MKGELASPDERLGRLKVVVGVLALLGCGTSLVFLLIGVLHLPIFAAWPEAGVVVMHLIIWPSTFGIVLGAGGGILAVRLGQSARYFAILTTVIVAMFAATKFTMAFLAD